MRACLICRTFRRSWPLLLSLVLLAGLPACSQRKQAAQDEFMDSMQTGKNYLDKGESGRAIEMFSKSVQLSPTDPDAHLNLANAYLLSNQAEQALKHADESLRLNNNSAAAHYVKGCAHLRLGQFTEAVQALQQSLALDGSVAATSYQLGLAHQNLQQWDEAITAFQTTIDSEPEHPAAHYNLSQALIRVGRPDEAAQSVQMHQQIQAKNPIGLATPATFEKSVHTVARVPFRLEQPAAKGIPVRFAAATDQAFSGAASRYSHPVGIIDIRHDGQQDLFVREGPASFRLLVNSNGVFQPQGEPLPVAGGAPYSQILVGALEQDRSEDALVLGSEGSHVFKFATNGLISDVTLFSRLTGLAARHGALVDFDFTGKLDLITVTATNDVRVFRNLGNFQFRENTATSGLPANLSIAANIVLEDWNNDDLMDVFVGRNGESPLFLVKQRGGPLLATNFQSELPNSTVFTTGDLNNDLHPDLIIRDGQNLVCIFGGLEDRVTIPAGAAAIQSIQLMDYDNDGWMDVFVSGAGLRAWRNAGPLGFQDATAALGLNAVTGAIESTAAADFDNDGDTDLLLARAQGLELWRNDGGNANRQLKVRLLGNRSNPSGLGIRLELTSGSWRTSRTVRQLPIEIGVGAREKIDSLTVRWFDLGYTIVDVEVDSKAQFAINEISIPGGSCPYLYAWDGKEFRFVTDLLGASPAGLPVAEGRYIEADPDEYAWLGSEASLQPRDGHYVLQITEELREVLYLDEAKLIVVDHPPGTEIYPTDKLVPGRPFPPSGLVTLRLRNSLKRAEQLDGTEVTDRLRAVDNNMVSPPKLRGPQLRGLAEPHGVVLDFGTLPSQDALVLGLTGWLRFGGGMANVAASHNPDLPFPFPRLEAEVAGVWQPVDVVVGAPCGKTKRMIVDLAGKLPPGASRLRLSAAFEIHWDHIALYEKVPDSETRITAVAPGSTDLHWRGFSVFKDLPWFLPLTPDYANVRQNPHWRITPSGWCTRYGEVDELVARKDDALVLLNGGDELTLNFPVNTVPSRAEGTVRDFFVFTVGWDKDADFHVASGSTVDPIPHHGMNDQLYGKQPRPVIDGDWWIPKYNTRWVAPRTLDRDGLTVMRRNR